MRCLACDVCPTDVDVDEVYRCIITSEKDAMSDLHPHFIGSDALVPVIYSPSNMEGVVSNYQTFIERTRYLRRGDYVMSNNVVTPYVIEEVGASSNMALRALTSMVRHHTILSKPLLEYFHGDATLNKPCVEQDWLEFLDRVKQITLSKLIHAKDLGHSKYNPVGYVLSADKDREDERMARRRKMIDNRKAGALKDAEERLG